MRIFIAIFCFLSVSASVNAQLTQVHGVVKDANTNEPLPFANVQFLGTSAGTITGIDGSYKLQTVEKVITVQFSFIGYEEKVIRVNQGESTKLNVSLTPLAEELGEVTVVEIVDKDWENPAHPMLRNIWKNKDENRVTNLESYAVREYEKVEFDLNNIDQTFMNRRIFKPFHFVFDYLDTSEVSGKNYLPFFFIENLYDVYYRQKPNTLKREKIAAQVAGFEDADNFGEFLAALYTGVDVYDNVIVLFEKGFTSPISSLGLFSYSYFLTDSAYVDGKKCYQIQFIPKRKQDLCFKGEFWVHDSTWAIQSMKMHVGDEANFNWVTDLYIDQEFRFQEGVGWVPKHQDVLMDFALMDSRNVKGIYGKRSVEYSQFISPVQNIDERLDQVIENPPDEALVYSEEEWENLRPSPLTQTEKDIFFLVDSVRQVPMYKTMVKVGALVFTGYYETEGFDIGPIWEMVAYNEVEGTRLTLNGRTYQDIDDRLRIYGQLTYGLRDQRFKYGLRTKYLFDTKKRFEVGAGYYKDLERFGLGGASARRMTLMNSLISRQKIDDLAMVQSSTAYFSFEPKENLALYGSFENRLVSPEGALDLSYLVPSEQTGQPDTANTYNTTEVNFRIRFSPGRAFFGDGVDRVQIQRNHPNIELLFTKGFKGLFQADFGYTQISFNYRQPLIMGAIGTGQLFVQGGKTFGQVPYPLLSIIPGNETFIYSSRSLNLVDYYEFVADQFVMGAYEHHFDGLILNRLPLIRLLKLREVVSAKAVYGTIRSENQALAVDAIPVSAPNPVYVELGGGLENIFRVLRLEGVWRLTYTENPERNFAILGTVSVRF